MRSLLALGACLVLGVACGGTSGEEIAAAPNDPAAGATAPPGNGATPSPPADAPVHAPSATPSPEPALTATSCFKDLTGSITGPDYDKWKPVLAKSCAGTHHQTITGIEKVVFLGDSVTAGTPPTLPADFYRNRLTSDLKKRFGDIAVADCSAWGARTDDFLEGKNQLGQCFPSGTEP
jgi:hypothetical protein